MSRNEQSHSLYRFDIQGGQVMAVYESENGRLKQERIDSDETYTVQGADVLKQEHDDGRLETTRYTDADGDGWYAETDEIYTFAGSDSYDDSHDEDIAFDDFGFTDSSSAVVSGLPNAYLERSDTFSGEKYRFDVQNDQVVAVYETENGRTKVERLDGNETYEVSGNQIIKTETSRYGQEVSAYTDADGDGLFVKVSEQWVASDSALTAAPAATSGIFADSTFGDDHLEVSEGRGVRGGDGADTFTVRGAGAMAITDFDHTQGDRLSFDTGLGINSVHDLLDHVREAHFDGKDFHLKLDQGMALTLVGVNLAGMSLADLSVVS